jgi:hypothetical protein
VQVAVKLLRDRANDGSQLFVNFVPSPHGGPVGKYQVRCFLWWCLQFCHARCCGVASAATPQKLCASVRRVHAHCNDASGNLCTLVNARHICRKAQPCMTCESNFAPATLKPLTSVLLHAACSSPPTKPSRCTPSWPRPGPSPVPRLAPSLGRSAS